MEYIAHKNENIIQTVAEHSNAVAELSRSFSVSQFADICHIIGLLHDIGKYQTDFQQRIRGDKSIRVEHSICGAKTVWEYYKDTALGLLMGLCIAGQKPTTFGYHFVPLALPESCRLLKNSQLSTATLRFARFFVHPTHSQPHPTSNARRPQPNIINLNPTPL